MDPKTREKVADAIKEECPLRTVLVEKKPCPYFGASGSCRDCTYEWVPIADNVGKLVKARRAAYEQEREKREEISVELKRQSEIVYGLVGGICAVKALWGLVPIEMVEAIKKEEVESDAGVKDSDKES